MEICIDFDGTCVTHEFPKIGQDIGAVPVLKELVKNGHNLILFTMRSDKHDNTGYSVEIPEIHNGNFLTDAVNWFKVNDIPLYGVNINPQQTEWTKSPKAYGQLYIDDAALGAPLIHDQHDRPFICWQTVRERLIEMKIIRTVK
jgi:hypothetical protein